MPLHSNLKARREELGMSHKELSDKSQIYESVLVSLENPEHEAENQAKGYMPSGKVLLKIAMALDTTIADLLDLPIRRLKDPPVHEGGPIHYRRNK